MKKLQTTFGLIFGILLIASFATGVQAIDEASVDIEITYVHNFNHDLNQSGVGPADMTNDIYVGTESNPVGSRTVTLDLVEEGSTIIDSFSEGDVPGLHVIRGEDSTGKYIDFTLYAIHGFEARESVKFEIDLQNAVFTSVVNGAESSEHIFERPTDGICGILVDTPEDYINSNDEYEVNIDDDKAEFCAVARDGIDRVRVYYQLEKEDRNGDNDDDNLKVFESYNEVGEEIIPPVHAEEQSISLSSLDSGNDGSGNGFWIWFIILIIAIVILIVAVVAALSSGN